MGMDAGRTHPALGLEYCVIESARLLTLESIGKQPILLFDGGPRVASVEACVTALFLVGLTS